jgi:hypothetical protein
MYMNLKILSGRNYRKRKKLAMKLTVKGKVTLSLYRPLRYWGEWRQSSAYS